MKNISYSPHEPTDAAPCPTRSHTSGGNANPLSKWLAPVALLALLLMEVGTAWGQTDVLPTITVSPASYTVNLQPSKTNEMVNIGPSSGRFAYKAAGSPEPTVECTASGGPPLRPGGYVSWQVTFTQADDGKTYTYTLIASNVAGVSKPATCTVTVKWNGATTPVTPVGPGVTPPVVTPPYVDPPLRHRYRAAEERAGALS